MLDGAFLFQLLAKMTECCFCSGMATKELMAEAMKLAPRAKARLAAQLLESLDGEAQKRVDALWAEEAAARIRAYEHGKMKSLPASQVLAYQGKRR